MTANIQYHLRGLTNAISQENKIKNNCRSGMRWEMGGGKEVQREETYVYLWLIHVNVWQKPTQYYNHPPITNKERINAGKAETKVR